MRRDRDAHAEGVETEETWGEASLHHLTIGVWERRKLPNGIRGGVLAENGFNAYLRSERSHLEHHFQYFFDTAGPPNVGGPRKLFPSPSRRASLGQEYLASSKENKYACTMETVLTLNFDLDL